ncbi:Fe-S biogenesis protein NfuA [Psychrosphaera sp. B3R10]|uniref:Fe/S biogenesis protein NfuA n=1 Tax=Psychrosphaera algicola TaxID=3023714 RepID=A0ABT5FE18_9GAMM|nr:MULTISPECIES: Fe-S biogenesis protein NfuA [unclassified Psychrosphaera]MBU2883395.1 Fe-S biogenesis protein NfuA [Psychrosphaera sp. I2R16]MBU2990511.1 Fe-S biogenesis protein NfuA [Psychrosphaera sp. B3R10]MDC2889769.1 Fe-S biogenesis protein NfuA [Psychrosphaera sp. G1-22]MDO6719015.1 Fe-S biogenesis protein NfuA [Psychrosphaera sp. 1_MG-2023]
MISISEAAQEHFVKLLEKQTPKTRIRIFVVNPGTKSAECGVSYCPEESLEEDDIVLPYTGFEAAVDKESEPFLEDAEIDFVTDQMGSQLTLKAPNAKARKVSENATLRERLQYFIDTEVNPSLAGHGGNCQIVEITKEGVVVLQFGGGCNGCSMIDVTLKDGIEKQLLKEFEGEVSGVADSTEHEAGEHSYY